ncbi:hypothetical protein D3C87_1321080 [compost metagenome]
MVGNVADDPSELAGRHVCAAILVDIPELHEDLCPGFRVGTAIERRKLPSLHLGDVVARPDGIAVIGEHQGHVWRHRQDPEKVSESDVVRNCLVDRVHVRNSSIQ